MTDVGFLLVHRDGLTWAVNRAAVLAVTRQGSRVALQLRAGTLAVDGVRGVEQGLVVRMTGPALRRFLPPACLGLGVLAGEPIAVVDANLVVNDWTAAEGGSHHGQ